MQSRSFESFLRSREICFTLLILVLVLGFRISAQATAISALRRETVARRESLAFSTAERKRLLSSVRTALRSDDTELVLLGTDAASGTSLEFGRQRIDVLYVLSTQCAACAANLGTLDSLRRSGLHVFAISVDDTQKSLARYAREHNIQFPVVAQATGAYARIFREGITPSTFILRDGRLVDLQVGPLAGRGRIGLLTKADGVEVAKVAADSSSR